MQITIDQRSGVRFSHETSSDFASLPNHLGQPLFPELEFPDLEFTGGFDFSGLFLDIGLEAFAQNPETAVP